ncbi:MAG TPA: mannose-1-phosphate guanylyltransferase/mannose-6-phosphate isomerase [Gammaproteobacteria bacterium]|nr:mannose-1-phosphate guanylyltransferase/mannose-6-phosphate isomerase [Gammaproteobacteria bacterium]
MNFLPVILAGGGGTRLWPLSRELYPKQFLALVGERSLLQDTVERGRLLNDAATPLVVCNEEHRFMVAEQLRALGVTGSRIVLEPVGRNTAPALTAAALVARADGNDPVLVMMPADHVVKDAASFCTAMQRALPLAEAGRIVTFGIVPTSPETGYGYIEVGARLDAAPGPAAHAIAGFREKPDAVTAAAYVAAGSYLWNSGIFMVRASAWLAALGRLQPAMLAAVEAAHAAAGVDADFVRLDKAAFTASPSDSIDYAVMEHLAPEEGAVVALDAEWSDVGAWSSLWEIASRDAGGNATRGDVCAVDCTDSMIVAEHRFVATLGCDDMVVVETADAVLVAPKARAQEVKKVVEWLKSRGRDERLTHRCVYRPWGSYEGIDIGDRFQVKRITVKPGGKLSLQMHHHRAEHWIVVSGTAQVTKGDEVFLLTENQSTFIPLGVRHRLENPGTIPLELIEVQSGSYLGEDDIVRFQDVYNRA